MNPMLPTTAVVTAVDAESDDTRTLHLQLPDSRLIDAFAPGQFNMLGLPAYGEIPVVFSDVRSGTEAAHTVRGVGRVTEALCRLQPGDPVQIRGPFGAGWPLARLAGKDIVLMIGGMGAIPVRVLLDRIFAAREDYGDVLILYGARTPDQMLFADEVERWDAQPRTQVRLTVDEVPHGCAWHGHVGVVTTLLEHPSKGAPADVALVCGPELMMRFAVRELTRRGLRTGRIYVSLERHMKCGIGHCGHCQLGPHYVCRHGPVFACNQIDHLPDTLL